jgi:structure-specific recognition protein 1
VSAEESEKIDVYRRMKTTDVQNGYELKPVSSRKRKNSTIAVVNDAAKDATTKKMIDSKKSKTDPDKPKRPPSAFMLFSHAFRKKNKGIAPNKIFKMIAEAWKDVSVDEKKSYDAEAKIEKEKWKKAMEKYQINSRIKG